MARISLVAFRGIGGVQDKEHPFHNEAGLVRAGHVAFGGIVEGKLIGFSPSPEAVAKAGGEAEIVALLIQHIAQSGCLQDDTAIFKRAAELAAAGERTTV